MVPSSDDDLLLVDDEPNPLRPPEAFVFFFFLFFVFAMCSSVDALTLHCGCHRHGALDNELWEGDKKECTELMPRRRGRRMNCMTAEVEQRMAFMLVGIWAFVVVLTPIILRKS